MTHTFRPEPHQADQWREQSRLAAAALKRAALDKKEVKVAFACKGGEIIAVIPGKSIREMAIQELADIIYKTVLGVASAGGRQSAEH